MSSRVHRICLPDGSIALIDKKDRDWVLREYKNFSASYHWRTGKALGILCHRVRDGQLCYLHRAIMGFERNDGLECDHIDGNPHNNRRKNLRLASRSQQLANRKKETLRATSSKYKGVTWNKSKRKWQAQSKYKGNYVYLGRYDIEEEAARSYDAYMHETFGEFARLNFPI